MHSFSIARPIVHSYLLKYFCNAACAHGADVVFLLDASGSLEKRNYQGVKKFVAELVEMLEVDRPANSPLVSRLALVTFGAVAKVEFHLDRYSNRDEILQAINVRYMGGATCTHDAIRCDIT